MALVDEEHGGYSDHIQLVASYEEGLLGEAYLVNEDSWDYLD
jgi:hypothetical protein